MKKIKHYPKKYRRVNRTEICMARMARKTGNFHVPTKPKLTSVIRISGIRGLSPEVCNVLQLLSLHQIFNGTFGKLSFQLNANDCGTMYCPPTLKAVNEPINKCGYGKINKKQIALIYNTLMVWSLGKYSIVCMGDLRDLQCWKTLQRSE